MTSAIETWAKGPADGAHDGDDQAVHEQEIVGGDHVDDGEVLEHDDGSAGDEMASDAARGEDAEAARLAAKKKKDMRTLMMAGVGALVLVVFVLGYGMLKARSNQQALAAQEATEQQQQPQQQLAQPAPGAQPGVIVERPDGTPVVAAVGSAGVPPTPADFGLATAPVVPTPSAPVVAAAPLPMQAPVVAPVIQASPMVSAASAATLPSPVIGAAPAVAQAPVRAGASVDSGEVSKLRDELASLRTELGEKAKALDDVRSELSELRKAQVERAAAPKPAVVRAAPVKPAQPKFVAAKKPLAAPAAPASAPAAVTASPIKETVVALPATPVKPADLTKKVRQDYRVYAVVDGRVWVMGPDGEATQIARTSPLADGSKVTNIDVDKQVVYTTAGEIR